MSQRRPDDSSMPDQVLNPPVCYLFMQIGCTLSPSTQQFHQFI